MIKMRARTNSFAIKVEVGSRECGQLTFCLVFGDEHQFKIFCDHSERQNEIETHKIVMLRYIQLILHHTRVII